MNATIDVQSMHAHRILLLPVSVVATTDVMFYRSAGVLICPDTRYMCACIYTCVCIYAHVYWQALLWLVMVTRGWRGEGEGGGGAGRGVGREWGLVFGVSLQSNHNDPSFLPVQTNPSRCIVCYSELTSKSTVGSDRAFDRGGWCTGTFIASWALLACRPTHLRVHVWNNK